MCKVEIESVFLSLSHKKYPALFFKIRHSLACFTLTFTEQLDLVVSYDGGSDL